jgi:hypothetical protein
MSGKGDTPRPRAVGQEEYSERWARTFGGRQCGKNEAIRAAYEAHRGPKILLSAEGTTLARLDATPERP